MTPTFTLYRGWPIADELVWSPFVTKVELALRLANVEYTSEAGSLSQSPKGKIPYITVKYSENKQETVSDSTLIINRLTKEGLLRNLNGHLSPAQQLEDLAIRALLEDKLYFYHVQERWITNYYAHRDRRLAHMALPKRLVVGYLTYRNIKAMLHDQGTGRFSEEEIEEYRHEIWQSIENRLAVSMKSTIGDEGPFWILGGSEATEADCTLFGFVTSVLVARR